jgi:E3 ubiquitin-protein ligase HERC3
VGGDLLAFGSNRHGQLGMGDTLDRMVPTEVCLGMEGEVSRPIRAMQVQCGASHTAVLCQVAGRPEVRSAGDNSYGQLGHGDRKERLRFARVKGLQGRHVACLVSGDWHNAAITTDGKLYTWGRGDCGQLGHGDDKSAWKPELLNGFAVVHPDRTLRRNRKPALKTLLLPADGSSSSSMASSSAAGRKASTSRRHKQR